MKLKIVTTKSHGSVIRRFPYLESELQELAEKDDSFRQLCEDYKELVRALKQVSAHQLDTRSDLRGLKTSLEVEILEQVSRKGAGKQN